MEEEEESQRCKCPYRRYYLSYMLAVGYMVLYSTRINLSVAIIFMTEEKNKEDNSTSDREFTWNEHMQGYALGSFFYGYILTQILGGYLAGVIGGNNVLLLGVIGSAILTFVAPVAAVNSFIALIFVRVGCGLFQGFAIPAGSSLWAKWAPPAERTILVSVSISGNFFSPILVMPLCGLIGTKLGWQWMFYVFGIISFIWAIIWFFTIFASPEKDKCITKKERTYIEESIGSAAAGKIIHPWGKIFGSIEVWAIVIAMASHNWGYYTVLLYGAKYFRQIEDFSIYVSTVITGVGYAILGIILVSSSIAADFIRRKLKTVIVRKIFISLGFFLQATFMLLVALVPLQTVIIVSVILAIGMGGITWAGFYPNPLDIAAPHSAIIYGLANTVATVPGIISPYITAAILPSDHQKEDDWKWVWIICAILYITGGIFFGIFARGEPRSWVYNPER